MQISPIEVGIMHIKKAADSAAMLIQSVRKVWILDAVSPLVPQWIFCIRKIHCMNNTLRVLLHGTEMLWIFHSISAGESAPAPKPIATADYVNCKKKKY